MDRADSGASTGMNVMSTPPCALGARPQVCRFKVPSNQVLVEPDDDGSVGAQPRAARARAARCGSSAAPGLISIPSGIAICSDLAKKQAQSRQESLAMISSGVRDRRRARDQSELRSEPIVDGTSFNGLGPLGSFGSQGSC